MEVVCQRCAGLDVHKAIIVACVRLVEDNKGQRTCPVGVHADDAHMVPRRACGAIGQKFGHGLISTRRADSRKQSTTTVAMFPTAITRAICLDDFNRDSVIVCRDSEGERLAGRDDDLGPGLRIASGILC